MSSLTDQTTFSHTWEVAAAAQPGPETRPLPTLTLLGHPDLERIGDCVQLGELAAGRQAQLSRRSPSFKPGDRMAEAAVFGRPLEDRFLSRQPLVLEPLPDAGVRLRRADSSTSVSVDGEVLRTQIDLSRARLETGAVLNLADRVVLLLHLQPPTEPVAPPRLGMVGESASLIQVRRAIAQVAPMEVNVLVTGPTGTGKELVARALHEVSGRRGDFIAVNVATLSPSLAAAELFGARKGAFTGAVRDQPGYFLRADGGTLFLDEIGETAPEVQAMLLRTLETGEVVAVGAQTPRPVDVRIVAATDADLEAGIADGRFKAPLLHRLAAYRVQLPPLAERREDLGRLLCNFLRQELGGTLPTGTASRPWLPAALVERLARAAWPGNIRQLRNVVRQLVIDNRGKPVLELSAELERQLAPGEAPEPVAASYGATGAGPASRRLSEIDDDELSQALEAHRWELKAAAEALGVPRTSLYSRLQRSPSFRLPADLDPLEVRRVHGETGGDLDAMVDVLQVSATALRQRLAVLGLEPAEAARGTGEADGFSQ